MDNIRRQAVAQRNLTQRVKLNREVYSTGAETLTENDLYLECGESIAVNDPVHLVNGLAYKAVNKSAIGIALTSGVLNDTIIVQYKGIFNWDGSDNSDLWNVNGALSNLSGTGFYQRLGTMINSGRVLLQIEQGVN